MVHAFVLPVEPIVCSLLQPQVFSMFFQRCFFLYYYTLSTFVRVEI